MTKISVIIPLYYGEHYIPGILEMLYENTDVLEKHRADIRLECIFVNDSPDVKVTIHEEDLKGKMSVLLITPAANRGIHGARALGLKHATGEFILFLDQDDKIVSDYFWLQSQIIGNSDIAVCNGAIHEKGRKFLCYPNERVQRYMLKPFYLLYIGNPIYSPGQVLIKRDRIPSFWKCIHMQVNGADDYLLWILLLLHSPKVSYQSKTLYYHIYTGKNISGSEEQMIQSETEMLNLLKKNGKLNKLEYIISKRRIAYKKWLFTSKNGYIRFSARFMDSYLIRLASQKYIEIMKKGK